MSSVTRVETPVSFTRHANEVLIQDEHTGSKSESDHRAIRLQPPQVASCILELKTLEQRDRFTLYKIRVNNRDQSWIIYRRYNDFVLLNKKLRKLFPQFRLNLPGKRFILDNFASNFIVKRQQGLEEFMRNVLMHRDIALSTPVQRFFRLDNPPQPSESLEASQSYCQSLEVSLASLRQQLRDHNVDFNALNSELEMMKYHKDENQDRANHLQQQNTFVEEATKSLRNQLQMSQENEQRAKEEVERLKEEMKAEMASVQAARLIARQRTETSLNRDVDNLRQSQESVNQRVESIVTSIGEPLTVHGEINGQTFKVDAVHGMTAQAEELKKLIAENRTQQNRIYRNSLEMYTDENDALKAELTRAKFQAEARASTAEAVRKQMEELNMRYQEDRKAHVEYIQKMERSFAELQQYAIFTEEKYFYSLVIGVKLNMTACGMWRAEQMNKLKPHILFERVRDHGISIEHWPSWVSRALATV